MMLTLYIYGYLNRVPSSRRLERECQRNIEMIWLTGQLAPDFKTIADFRKDNGKAIREVCREFVARCRPMGLLTQAVAIDGSKFKAVNNRDKNFTRPSGAWHRSRSIGGQLQSTSFRLDVRLANNAGEFSILVVKLSGEFRTTHPYRRESLWEELRRHLRRLQR
jgi:Transposase domain (DUF772)